ncbi:MAG: ECF transporter S component [Clostridia bacterium]
MKTKKLVYTSILIAISLLLPQIFHFAGELAGQILLPMHIGILLAGFIVGPYYAMFVGIIVPLLSNILMQMPAIPIVYFMVFELAAYGFFTGFFYEKMGLNKIPSLILSMLGGRIVYSLVIIFALKVLKLPYAFLGATAIIEKFTVGIPGMALQIFAIPLIVIAAEKGGLSLVFRKDKDRHKK